MGLESPTTCGRGSCMSFCYAPHMGCIVILSATHSHLPLAVIATSRTCLSTTYSSSPKSAAVSGRKSSSPKLRFTLGIRPMWLTFRLDSSSSFITTFAIHLLADLKVLLGHAGQAPRSHRHP